MRQGLSILLFAGNLTGISIDRLNKVGTTELEGKLGLLTMLCNLWIRSWVTVHVVDTHRPTCLPNILSGHLRCMSVQLGRVGMMVF